MTLLHAVTCSGSGKIAFFGAMLLFLGTLTLSACAHGPRPVASPAPRPVSPGPSALLTEAVTTPVPPPPGADRLRIVTYNVHFGTDVLRLAAAILGNQRLRTADVILLQEIRSYPSEGMSRAQRLASLLGLSYVYAPAHSVKRGGTHGVAVLSRYPVVGHEVLDLPPYKVGGAVEHRIALVVTLDLGDRLLRVYNVHLDTRLDIGDRLAQLGPVLDAAAGDPVALVGGDFNTVPFRWLRRTVPVARSRQAQGLDAFMRGQGYDTPTALFQTTMTTRLLHMRLDAIYLRGLQGGETGVEKDVRASDHVPLWLDVVLPPPEQTAIVLTQAG